MSNLIGTLIIIGGIVFLALIAPLMLIWYDKYLEWLYKRLGEE